MSNPYRDMCAELIGELHEYKVAHPNHGTDIIDRARALLDQQEPEGPTDEDLEDLAEVMNVSGNPVPAMRRALELWGRPTPPPPAPEGVSADEWDALVERAWDKYETVGYQGERFMYDSDFGNALDFVRKELAPWGRPTPQPPAAGEVAELVWVLHKLANANQPRTPTGTCLLRAADLLQRQRPQPVAVSERPWEREGWCDEQGRCWLGDPGGGGADPSWQLTDPRDVGPYHTHSLPASALPIPEANR